MELLIIGIAIGVLTMLYGIIQLEFEQKRHNQELEHIAKEQRDLLRQIEYQNRSK